MKQEYRDREKMVRNVGSAFLAMFEFEDIDFSSIQKVKKLIEYSRSCALLNRRICDHEAMMKIRSSSELYVLEKAELESELRHLQYAMSNAERRYLAKYDELVKEYGENIIFNAQQELNRLTQIISNTTDDFKRTNSTLKIHSVTVK